MRAAQGLAIACALAAAACAPEAPAPPEAPGAPEAQEDVMTMEGINLFLHDREPTLGAPRKPTFQVQADAFSMLSERVWSFEESRAVIYGAGPDDDDIVLEARRGRFEEGMGAHLSDGVTAFLGAMTIELRDIFYENPLEDREALAYSDHPVTLRDPEMRLEASGLRIYPDAKQIELTEVAGLVRFGGEGS